MKNASIVIPMSLPWDWSTDYYEQTARVLAKDNFVLCMQHDNPQTIRTIVQNGMFPRLLKKVHKRLYIYEPIDIIPFRRFSVIEDINAWINTAVIKALLWSLKLKAHTQAKILWLFDPQFSSLIGKFGRQYRVIYDIVDYLPGARIDAGTKRQLMKKERVLLTQADVVTVNSLTLQRYYLRKYPNIVVVPQGFRLDAFAGSRVLANRPTVPHDRPVIGYVGGINYRLDFNFLYRLINGNPHHLFVFAGQIQSHDEKGHLSRVLPAIKRLFSCLNCRYVGNVSKSSLPSLIESFDIAMIPYDRTMDFNRYSYPMKLFEYFYMGKPVVATPIEELKRFPKYVRIGSTVPDWEEHIASLLSKPWPKTYKDAQRKLATKNSWERKIEAIGEVIGNI